VEYNKDHQLPHDTPNRPRDTGADADTVAQWFDRTRDEVMVQVQERPILTVAAAMGVGYVLAGGLPNWVVRLSTRSILRAIIAGVVAREVLTDDDDPVSESLPS